MIDEQLARARDWDFKIGRLGGGVTLYPYQFAVGVSLRYWPCIYAPNIRVHLGPFKVWLYFILRRADDR